MLFIGEKVGTGQGPKIDIALDPLEGTTITAKGGANALAVLAMADDGGFLNAPDVYMDKIAVGGGLPDGVVDLDAAPAENLKNLARAKKAEIADLVVCILDRPRHSDLIAKVREAGARIMLIGDGDVAGVIATSSADTGIDIYMGSGGAPEGVLAAAALRKIAGRVNAVDATAPPLPACGERAGGAADQGSILRFGVSSLLACMRERKGCNAKPVPIDARRRATRRCGMDGMAMGGLAPPFLG